MKKKKVKNPLRKRILRELCAEWKKYLMVGLFLILSIGFVSGMYVANGSMLISAKEAVTANLREDGHFELNKKADKEMLEAVAAGKKADVRQYYLDKAKKELDKKFKKEFDAGLAKQLPEGVDVTSVPDYDDLYSDAYDEAWEKVEKEIKDEYKDAEEKYELDDPDFKAVKVNVYENFYRNEDEDYNADDTVDGTIRVYKKTDDINLADVLEGRLPGTDREIAIDRMHADNVGAKVGDTIRVSGREFEIVGLISYANYYTLHEKSTDLMFDALKFDVAMVTDEGFDRLDKTVHYVYAWRYEDSYADEKEEKTFSDNFMRALITQSVVFDRELTDYIPAYANPAITFATEDMGSDEVMGGVILNVLIVIIAFIFAVTISNTITKESSAIGTLRASGYTRAEMTGHYLLVPLAVTLISALIGNILGYTVFKNVIIGMYYNSYSLPEYHTVWNADAFVRTTVIPVVLMFIVNLFVTTRMMQHTPLQFLRRDMKKNKRKKTMRLPAWKFFGRFRLRIIFQNIPNYIILLAGILFIMIMLAMAVGMPSTLKYYQDNAADMMFAKYQYILRDYEDEDGNVITTDNDDAEKFNMRSLQRTTNGFTEEVSVYGVSDDSDYIRIPELSSLNGKEVCVSETFADKYDLKTGDTITLDEKYENKQYEFTVSGVYDSCQSIAVFMPIENYSKTFDLKENEFTGFLSNTEITDLDEDDVATVITKRDITKMCDQLDHSMGDYMNYYQILCILLSAVLIYLLTKIIIEKNENAISMTKILGYENKEIASLYLLSTTIVVVIADAVSVAIGSAMMFAIWKNVMTRYNGYLAFYMEPAGYIKMFVFVLIGYLVVAAIDFNRIKKIPMDEALKNAE